METVKNILITTIELVEIIFESLPEAFQFTILFTIGIFVLFWIYDTLPKKFQHILFIIGCYIVLYYLIFSNPFNFID